MATAILALQGDFAEHARALAQLDEPTFELRSREDLSRPFDRLVLPGGESTVQGRLLRELGLLGPLRQRIQDGLPVLATCAGLILLAAQITGDGSRTATPRPDQSGPWLATLDVEVERNAYGRQLGSFHARGSINEGAIDAGSLPSTSDATGPHELPLTFIRAPRITKVGPQVSTLVRLDQQPVAVRQGNQIGLAFHPELDDDPWIYQLFLSL